MLKIWTFKTKQKYYYILQKAFESEWKQFDNITLILNLHFILKKKIVLMKMLKLIINALYDFGSKNIFIIFIWYIEKSSKYVIIKFKIHMDLNS